VGSLLFFVVVYKEVGELNIVNVSCNRSVIFVMIMLDMVIVA